MDQPHYQVCLCISYRRLHFSRGPAHDVPRPDYIEPENFLWATSPDSYELAIARLIAQARIAMIGVERDSRRFKDLFYVRMQLRHDLSLRAYWKSFDSITTAQITDSSPVTQYGHLGMMFCKTEEAFKTHSITMFNYPLGLFYYWMGDAWDYIGDESPLPHGLAAHED